MSDAAIVLAGGLGTRLRSVVEDVPKPMAAVGGRPFLEHLLDYWIAQGIARFVLAVGYRAESIRTHFGARYRSCSIEYAEEDTPLGTGGALLRAADVLGGRSPFFVLNGDTFFAVDRSAVDAFADAVDADWCFSLFRTEHSRYMAIEVEVDGRIRALRSATAATARLANGGVYRVHPRSLQPFAALCGKPVSLEDALFPQALALGQRFFGVSAAGRFVDIGVPEDYARAASIIAP